MRIRIYKQFILTLTLLIVAMSATAMNTVLCPPKISCYWKGENFYCPLYGGWKVFSVSEIVITGTYLFYHAKLDDTAATCNYVYKNSSRGPFIQLMQMKLYLQPGIGRWNFNGAFIWNCGKFSGGYPIHPIHCPWEKGKKPKTPPELTSQLGSGIRD